MNGVAAIVENALLNVLIIEDSEEDADLIVLELKRGGYSPHFRRVDNAADMRRALAEEGEWDLVLSDYSMPRFSVHEALEVLREHGLDVPFVIVSATIGEEAAVEAMKAGAHDYILKHRLGRLVPAVRRELRESATRRERRTLEEQLRHAQRLESLGLLAGGVAHDFNNLLTGILGNASLVMEILDPPGEARGMLEEVIRASERAADLTRQLLAYAGKGKFVIEPLDLSALVRDIGGLIRTSVPRSVDLVFDLGGNLPLIEADSGQMQQLVMNLTINAVEAIGEAPGLVRVMTRVCDASGRSPVMGISGASVPPGRYVCLQVSDNGCGMSDTVKAQIFDPFFTTKFTGRGLGLAAALGIVRGHRGIIHVESAERQGSSFIVLLPAWGEAAAAPRPAPAEDEESLAGTGAILLVDDEDVVRRAAKAALEHYGYIVFEAANGRDGLDLFSRLHDRILLVLLDLTMPGMNGDEVWRRIHRIRPDMRVIVSSGYDESEAQRRLAEASQMDFIKKPYTAAALAEKVKQVLRDTA